MCVHRMNPEYVDPNTLSLYDALLRQPDEEDDEEEDDDRDNDDEEDNDNAHNDNGYSE